MGRGYDGRQLRHRQVTLAEPPGDVLRPVPAALYNQSDVTEIVTFPN